MLPALAAHAIQAFTQPGELVLDPMCGIGTTLVEAIHLGRDALGIEYEPRWADLAAAGLTHATTHGATGAGQVLRGDARTAVQTLAGLYAGRIALLLTSPPYGASVHGQVRATGHTPVAKWDHAYGTDRANLARATTPRLLAGFTDILRGCHPLLKPGGILAVTARPWRRNGLLLDFPSAVLSAATDAGYQPVQRCVALLAAIRDGRLVTRASFFQINAARRLRAAGLPVHLIPRRRPHPPQTTVVHRFRAAGGFSARTPRGRRRHRAGGGMSVANTHLSGRHGGTNRPTGCAASSAGAAAGPASAAGGAGEQDAAAPGRLRGRVWAEAEIRALGAVTDLVTAGAVLGMGRTKSHDLARTGAFPVPVLRHGGRYVVLVAPIPRLLGLDADRTGAPEAT